MIENEKRRNVFCTCNKLFYLLSLICSYNNIINKQWCFNKKNLNRQNVLTTVYAKMITNHRVHCVLKLINPLLNEQF